MEIFPQGGNPIYSERCRWKRKKGDGWRYKEVKDSTKRGDTTMDECFSEVREDIKEKQINEREKDKRKEKAGK